MTGNSIILATRGETAGENEGGHGRKGKRGDRGGTKGGALTRARTIDRVKPGRVLRKKDTVFRSISGDIGGPALGTRIHKVQSRAAGAGGLRGLAFSRVPRRRAVTLRNNALAVKKFRYYGREKLRKWYF